MRLVVDEQRCPVLLCEREHVTAADGQPAV
jgi:hypothetical protein